MIKHKERRQWILTTKTRDCPAIHHDLADVKNALGEPYIQGGESVRVIEAEEVEQELESQRRRIGELTEALKGSERERIDNADRLLREREIIRSALIELVRVKDMKSTVGAKHPKEYREMKTEAWGLARTALRISDETLSEVLGSMRPRS